MPDMHVRRWLWDDFPAVCEMALGASREYGTGALNHYFPPDLAHMYSHILKLFADRVGWVVIRSDKIVGVLALDTAQQPWNAHMHYLINSHFWIDPEHRDGNAAKELLEQARAFADDVQTPLKFEMTMGEAKLRAVDRFMRTQKFRHTGGCHWYVPPTHKVATDEEVGEAA